MDPSLIIASVIAAVVVIIIVSAVVHFEKKSAAHEKEKQDQLMREARSYTNKILETRILPTCETNLILKTNEHAFYSQPASLYETRAVRHSQAGHAGVRVGGGIYVGSSSGTSVSTQEWTVIDSGSLIITNKRFLFGGSGGQNRSAPLTKIISVVTNSDNVEITVENRQKSMVFESSNPIILSAVIRICCAVDNPLDLSKVDLNINFEFK